MSEFWITVIGVVAAISTTGSWIPQVMKTIRSRSARDFSWGYLTFFTFGIFSWLVYGILRHDLAIIAANGMTLALLGMLIGIKFSQRLSRPPDVSR